jgi:hypothetical protein
MPLVMDLARLKTITYRAIKTSTLIVNYHCIAANVVKFLYKGIELPSEHSDIVYHCVAATAVKFLYKDRNPPCFFQEHFSGLSSGAIKCNGHALCERYDNLTVSPCVQWYPGY